MDKIVTVFRVKIALLLIVSMSSACQNTNDNQLSSAGLGIEITPSQAIVDEQSKVTLTIAMNPARSDVNYQVNQVSGSPISGQEQRYRRLGASRIAEFEFTAPKSPDCTKPEMLGFSVTASTAGNLIGAAVETIVTVMPTRPCSGYLGFDYQTLCYYGRPGHDNCATQEPAPNRIFADAEDNIWIGTEAVVTSSLGSLGGLGVSPGQVLKYTSHGAWEVLFDKALYKRHVILNDSIAQFLGVDEIKKPWIALLSKGILGPRYDLFQGTTEVRARGEGGSPLTSAAFTQDAAFFGQRDGALSASPISTEDPVFRPVMGLEGKRVGAVAVDVFKRQWYGTSTVLGTFTNRYGDGIWVYHNYDDEIPFHLDYQLWDAKDPSNMGIAALLIDAQSNVWIGLQTYTGFTGTFGGGVVKCKIEQDLSALSCRRYTVESTKSALGSNNIRAFAHDDQGRIWVGTDKGISRYMPDTDTWHRVTMPDVTDITTIAYRKADNTLWFAGSYKGAAKSLLRIWAR
jgi:hypothetical protein